MHRERRAAFPLELRGLVRPGAGGYPKNSGEQAGLCRGAGGWEGRSCPRAPGSGDEGPS